MPLLGLPSGTWVVVPIGPRLPLCVANHSQTTMTKVSTEIIRTLERLEVEYLFGYPGGRAIELLEELAESDIEVVRPRDEREASVMAEMYGRLHQKPGVLTGQGPWIGSIGAIGQMEARLGSSPLVAITEASERGEYSTLAPYQQARGDYGGFALPKILDGITKEWWFPRTANETLRSTQLAFKHATAGRPGPTAVILDGDAVTAEFTDEEGPSLWSPKEQTKNWDASPTATDIEQAATALSKAERPVIVAGNGIHAAQAYDELETVAETYEAVVTTSSRRFTKRSAVSTSSAARWSEQRKLFAGFRRQ